MVTCELPWAVIVTLTDEDSIPPVSSISAILTYELEMLAEVTLYILVVTNPVNAAPVPDKAPVRVVAPKLLLLPAAVTLKLKVPDVADSAAVVVFPKLLELPAAVTLVLKVPEVPE